MEDPELQRWLDQGRWFDYLGFQIFYARAGAGEALVIIHGYPFSAFDFIRVWPELVARFDVIAPDMLGMGFSDKPARYEYTVSDHADMFEAVLGELGVSECHLLAHDLGDSVGQELLARHERGATGFAIKSITWLNGGMFNEAYFPRPVQKLLSATPLGDLVARLPPALLARMLERAVGEVFGPRTQPAPELLRQLGEIMDYNDGQRVTHKVGRFLHDRYVHRNRWVRAMRDTAVPMRLIDGPFDPNSGRHMAERYRELIPGADVVLLGDEIGHWPQLEDPEAVLRHFLEFVQRP